MHESQIDDAAKVLARALHDDPLSAYLYPDPDERRRRSPAQHAALVRFGHLYGEVHATDELDAVAVWQPPGSDVTPEKAEAAGLTELPAVMGQDAFLRFGRVLDYLETHRGDVPLAHWYLTVVGVEPARQGKGVGTALVRRVLERVDVPVFLDTNNPRTIPFYERLGFREHAASTDPDSGLRFWTLRRDG